MTKSKDVELNYYISNEVSELSSLKLNVCENETFIIAMWQPKAETEFNGSSGLNPLHPTFFNSQAKDFFEYAQGKDLILTPEYSFPWELINDIIERNIVPKGGSLWCFCMQGISTKDFEKRINIFKEKGYIPHEFFNDIFFAPKTFVNSLLYVFMLDKKLYILPQLKRHPVHPDKNLPGTEAYNMSLGNRILVFSGKRHFLSYICADANKIEENNKLFNSNKECIVFHPQLNEKAYDLNFCNKLNNALNNFKNLYISLNWAHGTKILGNEYSHGGYSLLGRQSNASISQLSHCTELRNHINYNHCRGLYFMYNEQKKHFYDFLYLEDQIIVLQIDMIFDEVKKYNLSKIDVLDNLLFDETNGNYAMRQYCRIDMTSIFGKANQESIFKNCVCKRDGTCDNRDSDVSQYEKFFCITLAKIDKHYKDCINEKEFYKHSDESFKRKSYAYSEKHDMGYNDTLNLLEKFIYVDKKLGKNHDSWDIKLFCETDINVVSNALFKACYGDEEEKGIILITDKNNANELFDLLLELPMSEGSSEKISAKNILLYYKKGNAYTIFDEKYNNDYKNPDYAKSSNKIGIADDKQFKDIFNL